MQSVVRTFSYADWSLRLGRGFNFVDHLFNYSKLQSAVPISCVNVLYTVHSDSIIYTHYSGVYFVWNRRENCQIKTVCSVLYFGSVNHHLAVEVSVIWTPGGWNIFQLLKLSCDTVPSKFYFVMEFLLVYKQSSHLSEQGLWCLVSTYTAYTSAF